MGDHADDAMEEERWHDMWTIHTHHKCEPDCPYCNKDFVPLFKHQAPWE